MFRLFGIRPGAYAIAATPPNTVLGVRRDQAVERAGAPHRDGRGGCGKGPAGREWKILAPASGPAPAAPPAGRPVGFSPVYYPGTLVEEEAGIFTLAPGQEMRISISLQLVPTARIEGTVVTADGQPAPINGVQVMLQRTSASSMMSTSMRMTEAGRFQAVGVPPGRYQIDREMDAAGASGRRRRPRGTGFRHAVVRATAGRCHGRRSVRHQPGVRATNHGVGQNRVRWRAAGR